MSQDIINPSLDIDCGSAVAIASDVAKIKIEDFDYPLPDERIPRHPLTERDSCRLLLSRPDGKIAHRVFTDLPALLPPSALMICNNTRVINARIEFHKSTGSRVEVFLLEPIDPSDYVLAFQTTAKVRWKAMIGNLKRWKSGMLAKEISVGERRVTLSAERCGEAPGNSHVVELSWDDSQVTFAEILDAAGNIPIPPYLNRNSEASDIQDYQTMYSRIKGSVAAPTAGLHFTPRVMDDLAAHNIAVRELTLHVGAGTFQPVKSVTIGEHPMHTESFSIDRATLIPLIDALREKRPVVAVGTTTVRTLESLPYIGMALSRGEAHPVVTQWEAYASSSADIDTLGALQFIVDEMDRRDCDVIDASTAIMIAPGFNWRVVDVMVTNFHQPQSTLLLLVSSFLERGRCGAVSLCDASDDGLQWKRIYREALEGDYRFLSYGDACLLFPVKR